MVAISIEISSHFSKEALSNLWKSRSRMLLFTTFWEHKKISGEDLFNSLIIPLALKINMPLIQMRLLSFINFWAVSIFVFSIKLSISKLSNFSSNGFDALYIRSLFQEKLAEHQRLLIYYFQITLNNNQ